MEAVSTSETSVNFYETTRRNIPEDSHLYTRRRENLKSRRVYNNTAEFNIPLSRWVLSSLQIYERS
jgi:hypothetical protein